MKTPRRGCAAFALGRSKEAICCGAGPDEALKDQTRSRFKGSSAAWPTAAA
mgnify:CR=1 FL=1